MVHDGWKFAFGVQCVRNVGNFPSVGDVLVTGCNGQVGGHFDGGRVTFHNLYLLVMGWHSCGELHWTCKHVCCVRIRKPHVVGK